MTEVVYVKHYVPKSVREELKKRGMGICCSKWCPDEEKPLSDLNSNNYCKGCTSIKNKKAKEDMRKRKETGEESTQAKRRRLRNDLSSEEFVCFGPLCGIDGKIHQISQRYTLDQETCIECRAHTKTKVLKERHEIRRPEGAVCLHCGESNQLFLEHNHIEPDKKSIGVSKITGMWKLKLELKKTELLCVFCHRDVTKEQFAKIRIDYEQKANESVEKSVGQELRRCIGILCNPIDRKMPLSMFSAHSNTIDKLNSWCKCCNGANSQNVIARNREHVESIKRAIGACKVCSYSVIDQVTNQPRYHHFDAKGEIDEKNVKISRVANLAGKSSASAIAEIDAEVLKCDLLCGKCHRLKTARDFGWINVEK